MRRYSLDASALMVLLLLVGCTSTMGQDDAEKFLEAHGWSIVGSVKESTTEIPSDFSLVSGSPPWVVWLDLSRSVGLDFSDHAGETVKILHYQVEDQEGHMSGDYDWQANLLVDQSDRVMGAWVTPVEARGMGSSIDGKDLEQVTGLSWSQYVDQHSQK